MSITNVSHVGSRFVSCVNRTFSCLTPLQARVLSLGLLAVGFLAMAWLGFYCRNHINTFRATPQPTPPNPLAMPRPGETRERFNDREEIGTRREGQLVQGTKNYSSGLIQSESGAFHLGLLHGRGCRREMRNGIVLEGEFRNGELIDGTKTYPPNSRDDSGNVIPYRSLRGQFNQFKQLYGENCEVISTDQSSCRGRFLAGQFVQGVQEFVSGPIRRREGSFVHNLLEGDNCEEVRVDENEHTITLRGKFERGQLVNGTMTYESGEVEQKRGTFTNNILTGHNGTVTYFDHKMLQGRFDSLGRLVEGERTFVDAKQNQGRRTENGNFTTPEVGPSHLHGKDGVVTFFNNDRWEGEFNDEGGLINGFKQYAQPGKDGITREEGRFTNNNLVNGTKTYQSGRTVSGTFDDNGAWHGEMVIRENGINRSGNFEHGQLRGSLVELNAGIPSNNLFLSSSQSPQDELDTNRT